MDVSDKVPRNSEQAEDTGTHGVMLIRFLVTILALAAAAAHLIWPRLKLDAIIVALFVVALVPWLGAIFESLELPGGFKMKYREFQRRLDEQQGELAETREQLKETQTKTERAAGAADSATQKAEVALAANEANNSTATAEQLSNLVNRYNNVRGTQSSSAARTMSLNQMVGQMLVLSRTLPDYPWREALCSANEGERMAGYAWLYVRPDPAAPQLLVNTLMAREDANFGQYWALQALQQCLPQADSETMAALTPALKEFKARLPTGSDRYYELSKVLDILGGLPSGGVGGQVN